MMGDAPERIFAWVYEEGSRRYHVWRGKVGPGGDGQTEYVRADLAPALRVRPLVWVECGATRWIAPAPLFGSFRVEHYGNEKWQALCSVPGYCATFADGDFATADEAKAAIEARILADLAPAPSWQPIETAPKDGTLIDVWGINHLHHGKHGKRIVNISWGPVCDWMGIERDDWRTGRGEDFEPTHWMPLPAPPEGK